MLGQVDTEKNYTFTTRNLGNLIDNAIGNRDPKTITEKNGYSPIVVDYAKAQQSREQYLSLPAISSLQETWRRTHLETEVNLVFWYGYTPVDQSTTGVTAQLVAIRAKELGVSLSVIPYFIGKVSATPSPISSEEWRQRQNVKIPLFTDEDVRKLMEREAPPITFPEQLKQWQEEAKKLLPFFK